jgi:hypothetical protein
LPHQLSTREFDDLGLSRPEAGKPRRLRVTKQAKGWGVPTEWGVTAIRRILDDFGSAYVRRDAAVMDNVLGEEFAASRHREIVLTRARYLEAMRSDTARDDYASGREDPPIRLYRGRHSPHNTGCR